MGNFLSMSGVIGADVRSVRDAMEAYAKARGGSLTQQDLNIDDPGCLIISQGKNGATVVYPGEFLDWDDASSKLSESLGKPVFMFHIHDGDLWMYVLYEQGEPVDRFNPMPDYWAEVDDDERRSWQGNAVKVAGRVPGLQPDAIARYLIPWSEDARDSLESEKAYPSDEFHYCEDWQLVDFMAKLGLNFPDDGPAQPTRTTYRFLCKAERNG
jgi:hypothetical protein